LSNLYIPPANEGQADTLSGTIYDAGPLDSFIMKIDWGEGSLFPQTQDFGAGTTDFYVSHAFADNGTYTVNVQLRDNHMQGPDSTPVVASTTATIANVAPTLTNVSATTINENGTTSVTGYINDPGVKDTFTMAVDWGDPRSPNDQQDFTFPASATGQQPFTLTHQYLDDPQSGSQYTIALNITDKDGGTSQTTTAVTVNNVAPSNVSIAFSPSSINGYGTGTLNGSFTDPGSLDTHTVVVNWGDGSTPTTLPLAAGVLTFSASHEYPNANPSQTYTATATVTDNEGAQAAGSTQMVVTHVFSDITNLSVTNSSEWEDETAYGGNIYPATPATITGTLVNFDPSQNLGVMIDWGDSSSNFSTDGSDNTVVSVDPVPNGDGTFSFTATHTYGVGGTYTVTVNASQGDDVATQTATAIVNYVKPTILGNDSGVGIVATQFINNHTIYDALADVNIVAPTAHGWYNVVFTWADGTTTTADTENFTQSIPTYTTTYGAAFSAIRDFEDDNPYGQLVNATVTVEEGGGQNSLNWQPGPSRSSAIYWG
jgi:hypothetical protein